MNPHLPPLPEQEVDELEFRAANRRSFLRGLIATTLALLGIRWVLQMDQERGLPWVLRKANDASDAFWKANARESAGSAWVTPDGKPFRRNGDVGLDQIVDESSWRLEIKDPELDQSLKFSIEQIRQMPSTQMNFDFKCIEGWSQKIECRGVKVSDFLNLVQAGYRSESTLEGITKTPYEYISLTSVDGSYYVSMDAKSFWHPQTLLCYEINGQPLTQEHGAPLRLMTAVKYGVKNIKQLGRMTFTDSPPADYWAERGYQDVLML